MCLTGIQHAMIEASGEPGLVLGYLRDIHAAATPRPKFSLPWSVTPSVLPDGEEYLIIPAFRFPCVVDHVRDENAIEISFNCQKFRFQESAEVLFERLSSIHSVPLYDFIAEFEASIGREEVVAFVTHLVTHGLIAITPMEGIADALTSVGRSSSDPEVQQELCESQSIRD